MLRLRLLLCRRLLILLLVLFLHLRCWNRWISCLWWLLMLGITAASLVTGCRLGMLGCWIWRNGVRAGQVFGLGDAATWGFGGTRLINALTIECAVSLCASVTSSWLRTLVILLFKLLNNPFFNIGEMCMLKTRELDQLFWPNRMNIAMFAACWCNWASY